MINVVGLGPGASEALTIGALEILKNSRNVFLRTEKHPTVDYLKKSGIEYKTYDSYYDSYDSFDEVYKNIAEDLIEQHHKWGNIVYAVPGHPLVAEKAVFILMDMCKAKGIEIEILPAVSFIDVVMERLHIDPVDGLKIIDAFDMKNQIMDKRSALIITQVYDQYIASEVKLALLEYYNDDTEVYLIRAAGIKGMESIRKLPLYEIDRVEEIDYLTSLYIPKVKENTKDFYDLLEIMETLRGENGCPWDKEQTHKSLRRYLIEESYEAVEAIDEEDDEKIVEELGDVLLQIVFHASIGNEEGYFNIKDIIESICKKMITRHPHVFGDTDVENSEQVLSNWDEIKKKEKEITLYSEEMEHISKALPALLRAEKIEGKAKKVGFDWKDIDGAMEKVIEEFNEIKEASKIGNKQDILSEIGDLLFSVVNVARFLDVDPEEALNNTNSKFVKRFQFIENRAREMGLKLEDMTLEEMDKLWGISKKSISL